LGRKSPLPGICGSWCSVMPFSESDCHTPSPLLRARPGTCRRPPSGTGRPAGNRSLLLPLARQVGVDDLHDLPLISGIPVGTRHRVAELRGSGGSPKPLTRRADPTRGTQVPLGVSVRASCKLLKATPRRAPDGRHRPRAGDGLRCHRPDKAPAPARQSRTKAGQDRPDTRRSRRACLPGRAPARA